LSHASHDVTTTDADPNRLFLQNYGF
jgi:hypothetical protein